MFVCYNKNNKICTVHGIKIKKNSGLHIILPETLFQGHGLCNIKRDEKVTGTNGLLGKNLQGGCCRAWIPGIQENCGIRFELGTLLIQGQSVTLPTSVLLTFCGFTRRLREALCASHRE